MKVTIEGTQEEIKSVLQAIGSSQEHVLEQKIDEALKNSTLALQKADQAIQNVADHFHGE